MKKIFVTGLAFVLAIVASITGTLAWLTAKTEAVTNTFTVGNINITLIEHKYDENDLDKTTAETTTNQSYKLIPGNVYAKDPVVTVKANSEKCYLFVEFSATGNPATYLTYTNNLEDDDVWKKLASVTDKDVYYKVVEASTADQPFHLLDGDKVTVPEALTKETIDAIPEDTVISLNYKAYAIQFDNMTGAEDAWSKISTAVATGEYNEAQ